MLILKTKTKVINFENVLFLNQTIEFKKQILIFKFEKL